MINAEKNAQRKPKLTKCHKRVLGSAIYERLVIPGNLRSMPQKGGRHAKLKDNAKQRINPSPSGIRE